MKKGFTLHSRLWLYSGETASWHFLTISKSISAKIKKLQNIRRGWGSVRVSVSIGETTWLTSIFPDARSGTYLLPVKASVRDKEDLCAEDMVTYTLSLV